MAEAAHVRRHVRLTPAEAERLSRIARESSRTEERLIASAVRIYLDICDSDSSREWASLSAPAFARVWDNQDDAVYDHWRDLYGVQEG
ncbi:MAG: hypothetical protein ACKVT1_04500 [Dehalococcoidia bacterium]